LKDFGRAVLPRHPKQIGLAESVRNVLADQKRQMKILLSTAIFFCGLFSTINSVFGQTWTPTGAQTNSWGAITASADGRTFAALVVEQWNVVWVSTNAGVTWTSNNIPGVSPVGRVETVAISAYGDKMAAVALYAGEIYTSTNYGATWASNSVPAGPWFRIASSADGTRLVALGGGLIGSGPIYVSADSGMTWTPANAPVTNWVSVASSANGSNWVAAVETQSPASGSIYTSTDCGLDWTLMTNAPDLQYLSIASSADGTKFIAAAAGVSGQGGFIYTSTHSGAIWFSNAVPNDDWISVASSADGCTLATVSILTENGGYTGHIYTSTNSGMTWISNSVANQSWDGIASSADGGTLVAAGTTSWGSSSGGTYILQTVPAPELNISPANSNLALSWLIPSTNFVLQQNVDLTTTDWVTLTNTPTLNFANLQNQVMLSPSNSSGFFRLVTQ
jgi:hypothetical protein